VAVHKGGYGIFPIPVRNIDIGLEFKLTRDINLGIFFLGARVHRNMIRKWTVDRMLRLMLDNDELARIGKNRSKAFVRKTRVKIKTVDSRVADLIFPSGTNKNWDIAPTPKPTISPEQQQQVLTAMAQAARQMVQPGQPVPMPPPAVIETAFSEIAKESAKGMGKVIDDQMVEARYKQTCLAVIHSGHLYGTGILKGPLVERKVRTRFKMVDGKGTHPS
jgi:hypothetical protein